MTDIIAGVVMDAEDRDAALVITIAPTPRSRATLIALPGEGLLRASVMGALAHGDRVSIAYDRNALASQHGAIGIARSLSVMGYEAVGGHAA